MKKVINKFLDRIVAFHTLFWCLLHETKFRRGFRVGLFVRKSLMRIC